MESNCWILWVEKFLRGLLNPHYEAREEAVSDHPALTQLIFPLENIWRRKKLLIVTAYSSEWRPSSLEVVGREKFFAPDFRPISSDLTEKIIVTVYSSEWKLSSFSFLLSSSDQKHTLYSLRIHKSATTFKGYFCYSWTVLYIIIKVHC